MRLNKYEINASESFMEFEFTGLGPRGKVIKLVQFSSTIQHGVFNLAFGDKNSIDGELDDFSVTNNGDSRTVLATVASTVLIFTEHYPGSWVYAEGSSHSRTRLYRMGISNHFEEINEVFFVKGLLTNNWESYKPGINCLAFAVKRR